MSKRSASAPRGRSPSSRLTDERNHGCTIDARADLPDSIEIPTTAARSKENSGEPSLTASSELNDSGPLPGSNKISAPRHLRPDTAAWWLSVADGYALEAHHLRILTLAAEAWDRGQEAREAITRHGSVYVDRFDQPRARPEVAIERDSRIAFARLVRELALDLDPPDERGRPPRIGGRRGQDTELDEEDRLILGLD